MTRKDYVALANALRRSGIVHENNRNGKEIHKTYVENVAEVLYRDNNRFDYRRFYEACGVAYD